MKRIFFVLLIFAPLISLAQVYEKGNIVAEAYYGGPNLLTATIRHVYRTNANFKTYPLEIRSFGPVGIRGEYLLTNRIGVGLNINYANTSVEGPVAAFPNDFGKRPDTVYNYHANVPRLRIMPSIFIHLGSSEKLDPYISLALGYSHAKLVERSDDPFFVKETISYGFPSLAFRGEFGLRYFFTRFLGVSGQVGFSGGPLIAGGLVSKF